MTQSLPDRRADPDKAPMQKSPDVPDPLALTSLAISLQSLTDAELRHLKEWQSAKGRLTAVCRTLRLMLKDLINIPGVILQGRLHKRLATYLTYLKRELHQLFDYDYYNTLYPDVSGARMDPLLHYIEYGAAEGRRASALFDTRYYLEHNPDVAASGINPLLHFFHHGIFEGRFPSQDAATLRRMPRVSPLQLGLAKKRSRQIRVKEKPLTSDQPLVSVIIPCFNYGRFLEGAVESVKRQSLKRHEIIIVEGGSTDGTTPALVKRLEGPGVRAIYQSRRCNAGENRLAGLGAARGRYIVFLDPDDKLEESYLEKAAFIAESLGVDIVSPDSKLVGDAAANQQRHGGKKLDIWETLGVPLPAILEDNFCSTVSLFRRSFWEKSGVGYPTDSSCIEDWMFWGMLAAKGASYAHLNEALHLYTIHSQSLTEAISPEADLKSENVRNRLKALLPDSRSMSHAVGLQSAVRTTSGSVTELSAAAKPEERSQIRLLLMVPWFDSFGSSVLLKEIFSRLRHKGCTITAVASEELSGPEQTAGLHLYKQFADACFDTNTCLCGAAPEIFLRHLIESRQINCLMIVGSRFAYQHLPWIKRHYPEMRIIDHLYNPFGHVESNKRCRKWIDFNIVANTDTSNALLAGGEDPGRIRIIAHGVNTRHFSPSNQGFLQSKSRRPFKDFTFGYLGRLSVEKRPVDVLKLIERLSDCSAHLVGRGNLAAEVNKYWSQHKLQTRVKVDEQVEDPVRFYAGIDCILITSDIEGLPITLLEAMSLGLPAIATRVGHIPELIQDGVNGFLYEPGDLEGLCHCASRLMQLSPEELLCMKQAARQAILEQCDIENCSRAYLETFSALLPAVNSDTLDI